MELSQFKIAAAVGGNVLLFSDKTYTLTPDKARDLAQQLQIAADNAGGITPSNELPVPFNDNELALLYHHKALYEQQHQTKFIDLGAFVSHIVSQQFQAERSLEVSHA